MRHALALILALWALPALADPVPVVELDASKIGTADPWVRIDNGDGVLRPMPNVVGVNVTPRSRKPGAVLVFMALQAEKIELKNSDGSQGIVKVVHPETLKISLGDATAPAVTLPSDLPDAPNWAVPQGPQWTSEFRTWARFYDPTLDPAQFAGISDLQERLKAVFVHLSEVAAPVGVPAVLYGKLWLGEAMRLGWHRPPE